MPITASTLAALLLAASSGPAPLTPKEREGRQVYHEGLSPSGSGVHVMLAGTSLPAAQVTCVGCHGDDGLGRPEGGVTPTPVTWAELTKPWGRKLGSGRRHPPYDERTFARAVTEGVDSAGNPLDPAMPVYSISRADMEALVAYMKRLGDEPVAGVGGDEIRIGTVVPERGPFAALGGAIRGALETWADETNAAGGIHRRRVALHVAGYDPGREGGLESARRLLAGRDLLALVSGFTPAVEPELADLAEAQGVPLVGPFTPWPAGEEAGRRGVFYLLGGPREHARVLAGHAVREGGAGGGPAAILHPEDPRHADAARAAAERFREGGWAAEVVPFGRGRLDPAFVAGVEARGARWVLFLGEDPDLEDFFRAASAREWAPWVLASGALCGRATLAAPPAFRGRVLLAMPTIPADETAAGREALARAARRAGEGHHAARAAAWAAARVLGEGLRRAGRGVTRERLAASFEVLSGFETGVLPPLSYGTVRRIGAAGAWLVLVDLEAKGFRPLGGFVPVD